ncbi:hypothetical protein A6V39_01085 [Candidatus Mycoplasma haematobovis]|uniref:Uncharacterized protein n=1 Tax=Candidatus Mycoplasma haematobovis TaxID=432608 RepID=A0A1A9QDU7_9MOLU|nr:hypothetical protein [Candidatus Mycoplasma haematobovis]OAL10647.1 hypothetical protein A6V39_01085 [Candidatus Mycoplasma haematobovis]
MISFVKFLKIVLPIISATTATLTTASLVSRKKHDPDEKTKSEEINLNSFVTIDENFREKLLLFSTDGKGENITVEDAKKAKKLIDNLKKDESEGDLPDFKSPEEAMEFLEKMPEKILSDLLKGSNLSPEELSKLASSKFGKEGKLGKVLKSPQFNFGQNMNHPQSSGMQDPPRNMFNGKSPNTPKMSMNMESQPDLKQPDFGPMKNMPNIDPSNMGGMDEETLNTMNNMANTLSDFGRNMQQGMPAPAIPPIGANDIPYPNVPNMNVNIRFGKNTDQSDNAELESSEKQDRGSDSDAQKPQPSSIDDSGQETNNELQQDMVQTSPAKPDSYESTNEIPEDVSLPKDSPELKEPTQSHESQNAKGNEAPPAPPAPHNMSDRSTNLGAPKLPNDMSSNETIDLNLEIPPMPDLVLPDLSSLQGMFGDLFKNNPFGTGGSEENLSLGDLRTLADSVFTTEQKLDNLIKNS